MYLVSHILNRNITKCGYYNHITKGRIEGVRLRVLK